MLQQNSLPGTSASVILLIPIQIIILSLMGFLFSMALLAFAMGHLYLILKNQTTIESLEKGVQIFDLGWKRNWEEVMGRKWILWFMPVR